LITKRKYQYLLIGVLCNFSLFSNILSQEYEGKPTPHIIKVDFKLPTALLNKPFKTFMSGIIDADLSYQYALLNGKLSFGIGAKYSYWHLIGTKFQNQNVVGHLNLFSGYFLTAFKKDLNDKLFFDSEIKFGYASVLTRSNKRSELFIQNAYTIEPKIGLYLKASELSAVGITVNYHYIASKFTPENLNLTYFPGFNESDYTKNYSYFSIGLGAYLIIPSFK
jgi:hypothetical protein